MDTQIDPQKVLAVLEAEKAKRNAARIESGEVIFVPSPNDPPIILGLPPSEAELERMKAAMIARAQKANPGKRVLWNEDSIAFIITGVPGPEDPTSPEEERWARSQRRSAPPPCDTTASEVGVSVSLPETPAPSQSIPTRVWITVQPATEDGFPGRIEEAYFVVLDGTLVLSDAAGFHIASEQLRPDDDPAAVARSLLSRATAGSDFNRPIYHRPLSIA